MSPQSTTSQTTSKPITREWAAYRLVVGTNEATLLAVSGMVQPAFLRKPPGFIRQGLLKGTETQ